MVRRFSWLGVGLIAIGAAMILDRLNVISWSWHIVLWALLAFVGAFKVVSGFQQKYRGRAFWGTMLFLFGLYGVLSELDLFGVPSYLCLPLLMLMVGMSFLVTYISSPRDWYLLVPALSFLGIGGVLLLTEVGVLYRWDVLPLIKSYWPVTLILFGLSLLLSRRSA
jgi:hypothetical protein